MDVGSLFFPRLRSLHECFYTNRGGQWPEASRQNFVCNVPWGGVVFSNIHFGNMFEEKTKIYPELGLDGNRGSLG